MTKSPLLRALLAAALCAISLPGVAAVDAAKLVTAAKTQIGVTVKYDPRYEKLAYPGGDVPIERGVCTDVLIRAYRKLGVDLPQLVQDMPHLKTPLCLVVASQDQTISPRQASRVMANLQPSARRAMTTLPGLGHLAHEERPDLVAAVVMEQFCIADQPFCEPSVSAIK